MLAIFMNQNQKVFTFKDNTIWRKLSMKYDRKEAKQYKRGGELGKSDALPVIQFAHAILGAFLMITI